MLFALVAYWHELQWLDIAAMFLYLMNYDGTWPWMVGHLWSLSVEEQFYFLWPSALRKFFRHRVAILLAVIAVGPIFIAISRYFRFPSFAYSSFPAVADNLAIGCLLAIFFDRLPKISRWAALAMLLTVVLAPQYGANSHLKVLFQIFALQPIVNFSMAGILLHVVQRPYRFLNIAPVVWLGKISYSLYLWQQPFFFARPGQPAYRLLFGIGLACVSYYFVEQPVLQLREKRAVRLRANTTAVEAA
jgi:peptidoglycan/LPS O-acetylase OafA/YrhL